MEDHKNSSSITLPGAIIIAGAMIAAAFIWTQRPAPAPKQAAEGINALPQAAGSMQPVSASDHILGNPNAKVMFVEYSDPSCPFCKTFNSEMVKLMGEYGPGGDVAWVYRHFPLDKPDLNGNILHPNSGKQSAALECAAALGGSSSFWTYERLWYERFPEDGGQRSSRADMQQIESIAEEVGLDPVSFNECIASGRFQEKIDAQYADGLNAGVTGTPFTVVLTPSGGKIPLSGAVSYETLKRVVETLLAEEAAGS